MVNLETGIETAKRFFAGNSASYDHISLLCTFGADRWWKHKIISMIPSNPTAIMDQACGTGILSLKIARRFPCATVVGVDVTEDYLRIAQQKASRWGVKNVRFLAGRAEDVASAETYDCVVSSYLAKYANLPLLVASLRVIVREGGTVIIHDFTYPRSRVLTALWEFYFMVLQTVGSRFYSEWTTAFQGLPFLLKRTRWVEDVKALLAEHGFSQIRDLYMTFGTSAVVTANNRRPG
jgi:demethylmenaquinone methyltransferase / 2-methoxy-6-polyprenyl-1,4-benzoquinol methylase